MSIVDKRGNKTLITYEGALYVSDRDKTSQLVGGIINQTTGAQKTLAIPTVLNTYTVELDTGHGFIANENIFIAESDRFYQAEVLSVATDTLTLDTPLDFVFTTSAIVVKVVEEMAVDGSVTRQEFTIGTGATSTDKIHFTGMRINIMDGVSMDDGKFGGIAALTRGCIFRIKKADDTYFNIGNAKTNGDLGLLFDNKVYTAKGAGGDNSVEFTWKVQQEDGAVIFIEPGDAFQVIVQDDLRALSSLRIRLFGHIEDK